MPCVGTFADGSSLGAAAAGNMSAAALSFSSATDKFMSNATVNATLLQEYMTNASSFERFIVLVGGKVRDKDMFLFLTFCYAIATVVSLAMSALIRVLVIRSGVQTLLDGCSSLAKS